MSSVFGDVSFALRRLRQRWTATLPSVLILAVGLGATTAVFTVVYAVLLRPLPYQQSHRLVSVWETFPQWRNQPALSVQWDRIGLSYEEYRRVATSVRSLESVAAAYFRREVVQAEGGSPMEWPVARGSISLMPLLGVRPVLGRWFLPGEEGPGAPHVAVLSHALWQTRYGADPLVIGKTIDVGARPYEIVGVLPQGLAFGSVGPFATETDAEAVWVPIGSSRGDLIENSQNYEVIARLAEGIAMPMASDEVRRVVRAGRDPDKRDARLVPRLEAETGSSRTPLVTLFGAALLLLGVTCANLAALQLGETSRRTVEIRTRLALGAPPSRLVRQLLTETLALTLMGAVAAVPVAMLLVLGLLDLAPERLPREATIVLGWPALVLAVAAALVTGVVVGIAPARLFGRAPASGLALGDRAVTARRVRVQQWMVAAETALSMVLLVAAALLLRSLWIEQRVVPGFLTSRILTVEVAAPDSNGAGRTSSQFFADVGRVLGALPAVEWVSATSNVPLGGNDGQWSVSPDPAVKLSNSSPNAQHDVVWPGYFDAMGIGLVAGRTLDVGDTADRPRVAVVNETMARRLWPGAWAVGRQFLAPNGGTRTIVGIVADIRQRGLGVEPRATFYESVNQQPVSRITFVIRTRAAFSGGAAAARKAVLGVDRSALVERVATMDDLVADSLRVERFRLLLLQFFGLAALAVTALGLAGVAVHSASVRMRELCVRMAIGATPANVRRLILSQYAWAFAMGVAAGGALAAGAMRVASSYLFGVSWYDLASYLGAGAMLALGGAFAGWVALRRLGRVDLVKELTA